GRGRAHVAAAADADLGSVQVRLVAVRAPERGDRLVATRAGQATQADVAALTDRDRLVARPHPEQRVVAAAAELVGGTAKLVEVADRAAAGARDLGRAVHAERTSATSGHTSSPPTKMNAGRCAGSSSSTSATKSAVDAQRGASTRTSTRPAPSGASPSRHTPPVST